MRSSEYKVLDFLDRISGENGALYINIRMASHKEFGEKIGKFNRVFKRLEKHGRIAGWEDDMGNTKYSMSMDTREELEKEREKRQKRQALLYKIFGAKINASDYEVLDFVNEFEKPLRIIEIYTRIRTKLGSGDAEKNTDTFNRLLKRGYIQEGEDQSRRKIYSISEKGEQALQRER